MASENGLPRVTGRLLATAALAFALGGLAATEPGTVWAGGLGNESECRQIGLDLLEDRGLPRSEVRIYFVEPDRVGSGDDNDDIRGYTVWARRSGCDGSLALVFNQACQFRRAYATGNCELPPGAGH